MPRLVRPLLLALCVVGLPVSLLAETPQPVRITITGTGLPTDGLRNPVSVATITQEEITHKAPVSVATLLQDIPGVQISEEGIERISIRGETPRRVAIFLDGQKLTDHTEYGQPVMVDPTLIERIEVVRGASSVISGSSATGGVINIITKKGADKPISLTTTAGYFSATQGYRASAALAGTVDAGPGLLDYNLHLGRMEQGDRRTPGGRLVSSDVDDRSISGHLGYRLHKHEFGLKLQRYDVAASVWTGQPGFEVTLPRRDFRKAMAYYEGSHLAPWLIKLSASAWHQTVDREFMSDIRNVAVPVTVDVTARSFDDQATNGADVHAEMRFSSRSRTVAGLEWEDDRLTSDKETTTTLTPPGITTVSTGHDRAGIRTWSLYGQHEMTLSEQVVATVGARWYRVRAAHSESTAGGSLHDPGVRNSGRRLLGSAGLVWLPSDRLALRANVAQGYTYPTLGQLFLTTTGGGNTFAGNPALKPELSTTYELGARYSANGTVLDATLFHTRARDYIGRVYAAPEGTFENIDAARSWGLELAAEHQLAWLGLTPHASLLSMQRRLHYGNGLRTSDGGAPSLSGVIGVRKDWTWDDATGSVDLYLRGESRVRLRDSSDAISQSSAGWSTLNLRGHVRWRHGLSLVVELNNLTNRRYQPYGQFPGAERSLNLFVHKTF